MLVFGLFVWPIECNITPDRAGQAKPRELIRNGVAAT
jgi:hypothetical protein